MEAVTASYHKETAPEEAPETTESVHADGARTEAIATDAPGAPSPSPSKEDGADVTQVTEATSQPDPKPPSKPPPAQGPRLPSKTAPKKKVGTLHQEEKWREYASKSTAASHSLQRKNSLSASLLKVATMSKVERMSAAVPVSRVLRLVIVVILTLLFCMIKEGDHLVKGENPSKAFVMSEQRMLESCSSLLTSTNIFQASSVSNIPAMARACVNSTRVVVAMVLAAQSQFAWVAQIERPIVYIGLASLAAVLIVFLTSYVFPRTLVNHVDGAEQGGNDAGAAAMLKKMMTMLPSNVLTAFHSANLLRTMVNAAFIDASCYIVIMVTYQLVFLAQRV